MKWISVKDRLPDFTIKNIYSRDVLITDGEAIWIGNYINGKQNGDEENYFDFCGAITEEITHWMPLPEPPDKD